MFAASRLPLTYWTIIGEAPRKILQLHKTYGDVIRVAPDQLAYTDSAAWKDIYGYRQGRSQLPKDLTNYPPQVPGFPRGIVTADDPDHARFRRLLSHAFSAKALEAQEPRILKHVDRLTQNLSDVGPLGPQDLVAWYNWTTFDLIGDLTYGEPFNCLKNRAYHPWVMAIFTNTKLGMIISYIGNYPFIFSFLPYVMPKSLTRKRLQHFNFTKDRVSRRLREGDREKSDFLTFIHSEGTAKELSFEEIVPNASTLIIAGSETTATLLSGATYLLCQNQAAMNKIVHEIRSTFQAPEEITMANVSRLNYTTAVLNEALRLYPPLPGSLSRVVTNTEGEWIAGQWVPPETRVGVFQWAAGRSASNFHNPESFIPERWLDRDPDSQFGSDDQGAIQPFSTGPRNCIGKNLAYMEMRLILAHVLYRFDLSLPTIDQRQSKSSWFDQQKMRGMWEKVPLLINVRERAHM